MSLSIPVIIKAAAYHGFSLSDAHLLDSMTSEQLVAYEGLLLEYHHGNRHDSERHSIEFAMYDEGCNRRLSFVLGQLKDVV